MTEGVRPLEPLPDAPLADEIDFNAVRRPYETPTLRPMERPATGFEDIPPRATQVDESIPSETIPSGDVAPTSIPSGGEAVQRLNNRLAELDAEKARLLDIYSRLRYMQRNGETRLIRGAVDPDAPHAAMPNLPEPPVEPLMPPDVPPAAIDPNARLTKPANWQSTQRTAGVQAGDQVQTVRSVYGFEREGTVSRVRGTMVEVELYNHIRKRVETKRFKLENVKRVDRAPTPNELEEGRKIAEAAGMAAQPQRTRAPYETPTLRPVARPDDIAYAGYPKRAYETPTMRPVAKPDDIPAAPYGPQPAERVQSAVKDRYGKPIVLRCV